VPPGRTVEQLVRQVDLTPTLLDVAGVPIPSDLDGTSLLPAVESGAALSLEAFIEAFGRVRGTPRDRRTGWRTSTWKCIVAPNAPDVPDELYDLAHDPRERRNVAGREPARVAELRARIAAVEARGAAPVLELTDAERDAVESRLRDLGYLE
jgi:arylsulfatase A-like enzyme